MNEGSLRCDVNLSVRRRGEKALGTRTEMKNLNSFQFIVKAIEYEADRQAELIKAGEKVVQETRRYDQASGRTYSMRKKEDAHDYRYFPDPDLAPIAVDEALKAALSAEIPELPDARKKTYVSRYGLSSYDAEQLVSDRGIADYFERAAAATAYPKLLANLIITEVFRLLPPEQADIPVSPEHMASLATLLGEGRINSSVGKRLILSMWESDRDPALIVAEQGLEQVSDEGELSRLADEVIAENPRSAEDYMKGREKALQALVGRMMAKTRGKGNPQKIQELLREKLTK